MPQDLMSAKAWKQRFESCRQTKKEKLSTWQTSVAYRKLKPFKSIPTDDTVNVPEDWSRTKNKSSQLWVQVPELKLKARRPEWKGATAVFAKALNFELTERVKAEYMMTEVLSDVINAAGIGICKLGYEATFEDVEMPGMGMSMPELGGGPEGGALSPEGQPPTLTQGGGPDTAQPQIPPPMVGSGQDAAMPQMVSRPVYECYYARRISPVHFLWPDDFVGSDWEEAPWLGWEGYRPLAEAIREKWVKDDFKGVQIKDEDWWLTRETKERKSEELYVKFVEVFVRATAYDAAEKDARKIKRLVFVEGPDGEEQVVSEDFTWQKYVAATPPTPGDPMTGQPGQPGRPGRWVGMTTFPIKVVTLTNISDMAIPPSDSEAGRAQVRELINFRSLLVKQRQMSLPLRWYDVNAVDEEISEKLRRGKVQDMIPMNGPGDRAIGEVARANVAKENFEADKVAKADLDTAWSIGQPQMGASSERETTATEVKTQTQALNVRLEFERALVLKFFLSVAKGIGNLMQMFSDQEDWVELVGQDGVAQLQAWDKESIQGEFVFEAKPDSQLKVDMTQKRNEALSLYKLVRRDPLINAQGLVSDLMETYGMDPTKVMVPPQPPKKEEPKISYSFKGEDLMQPYVIALQQKTGTPVTAQDIAAAMQLIQQAQQIMLQQQEEQLAQANGLTPPQAGMAPPGAPQPPQGPQNGPPPVSPSGSVQNHPGPPKVVDDIGRRYEQSHGIDSQIEK